MRLIDDINAYKGNCTADPLPDGRDFAEEWKGSVEVGKVADLCVLDRPLLESSFEPHTRKFRFTNPYRQTIGGAVRLTAPPGWRLNPPTFNFTLNPGERFERELTIEFPYNSFAGSKVIQAEVAVQADTNTTFSRASTKSRAPRWAITSRLSERWCSKSNSSRVLRAGNRAARMRISPPLAWRAATSEAAAVRMLGSASVDLSGVASGRLGVFLQANLKEAVNATFNMITIDGDQSTNDTCAIIANGAAGGANLRKGTVEAEAFQAGLKEACKVLAKHIAGDGEGATALLEVRVEGASTLDDARTIARRRWKVCSSLICTAPHPRAGTGRSSRRSPPRRPPAAGRT